MASADDIHPIRIASFGPFRLNAAERRLERNNEPVVIGGRSLDILIALTERAGEVISRRNLIALVWPDLVVEDANLRVHVSSLRKALGDGLNGARYVANVPGRGYCFVAPVHWDGAAQRLPHGTNACAQQSGQKLPPRLTRMVGRDDTVADLSTLLRSRRFVSVVGAGGMGKTTVAIGVAHALLDEFENSTFFVDLGALTDATLLPFAIASALGFQAPAKEPMGGVLAAIGGRRSLLLLDGCEHVIAAAAAAAERLFSDAPEVHLLVTSREALRVEGEHVHLLHPLATPPRGVEMTAGRALASPAVQLFMDRAAAGGHRCALNDADATVVADMCRRLDGIALAIELAASRVATYGIKGTADLLDDRFRLLWQGRRSAVPRHQTLQAMLDWSYHLLSDRDRRVFCRLSVFVGMFALEGVQAVAADAAMDGLDVAGALASLVDKSLIWASAGEAPVLFRLLDTTRAYAAAKLAGSGEENQIARRHARHYCERLKQESIDQEIFRGRNFSAYAPHIGNVRAAVEWSFSYRGDRTIAVELAARSAPLFLGLWLAGECRQWCERGLAAMDDDERGTQAELALRGALAISAMYTDGNSEDVRAAIERALEISEALRESRQKLHLLMGLNVFLMRRGEFGGALEAAERSVAAAQGIGSDHDIAMADWILGCAHHLVGDQERAQRHCEQGFERAPVAAAVEIDFFGDHRVRAQTVLARTLWLRGFPERAARLAHKAVEEAQQRGHPVTLGLCLIYACTVSIWCGNLDEAAEHIDRLMLHASRHSLRPYEALGAALTAQLEIARGEPGAGVARLRNALGALQAEQHHILRTTFSRALAEGLALTGEIEDALATIDAALGWAEQEGGTYDLPDLLRTKGQLLLSFPRPDTEAAERLLLRSLAAARQQSALSWELRAAVALGQLWIDVNPDAARERLAGIYRQFTEGFGTADLKTAEQLLGKLGPTP